MKSIFLMFCTAAFILLAVSCTQTSEPKSNPQRTLYPGEQAIADAGASFGLDIFREIAKGKPDDNIFISPLSISMALSMAYNGAGTKTAEEMRNVLGFNGMTLQEVNESYQSLMNYLTSLDPKVRLAIANSVWCADWVNFEQPYQETLNRYYKASITKMNFSDPNSKGIINQWASDNTQGKIKDVIDQIDPSVVMFLLNAIYFKGDWTYQFDKKDTKDESFYKESGETISVKMMKEDLKVGSYSNDLFSAVDLPYGNKDFSMTLLLPNYGKTTSDILNEFTKENWNSWTSQLTEKEISVALPKFKLECEFQLKEQLEQLGMISAFNDADFKKICVSPAIFISKVQHNSFVDVNEEGTEAAAVTVIEFRWESTGNSIRFNKPFVIAIREKKSNTILFLGKIMSPETN